MFHAWINLNEDESLLVVIREQINLQLSQREVYILILVVCDCQFDTNSDHPRRLTLGHDLENCGRLALLLDPRSVDDIICIDLCSILLSLLLQLHNSVTWVANLSILGRAPHFICSTQVEHALRVGVHELAADFLKSNSGHLCVFLKNDTGRLLY